MRQQQPPTGPVWLLLLLVSSGLFLMHTLGHFDTGQHCAAPAGHSGPVMAVDGGHDGVSSTAENPAPQREVPGGVLAACVAILCAVIVIGLDLAFGASARLRDLVTRLRGQVVQPLRGPPRRPVGLSLACLSVSRN